MIQQVQMTGTPVGKNNGSVSEKEDNGTFSSLFAATAGKIGKNVKSSKTSDDNEKAVSSGNSAADLKNSIWRTANGIFPFMPGAPNTLNTFADNGIQTETVSKLTSAENTLYGITNSLITDVNVENQPAATNLPEGGRAMVAAEKVNSENISLSINADSSIELQNSANLTNESAISNPVQINQPNTYLSANSKTQNKNILNTGQNNAAFPSGARDNYSNITGQLKTLETTARFPVAKQAENLQQVSNPLKVVQPDSSVDVLQTADTAPTPFSLTGTQEGRILQVPNTAQFAIVSPQQTGYETKDTDAAIYQTFSPVQSTAMQAVGSAELPSSNSVQKANAPPGSFVQPASSLAAEDENQIINPLLSDDPVQTVNPMPTENPIPTVNVMETDILVEETPALRFENPVQVVNALQTGGSLSVKKDDFIQSASQSQTITVQKDTQTENPETAFTQSAGKVPDVKSLGGSDKQVYNSPITPKAESMRAPDLTTDPANSVTEKTAQDVPASFLLTTHTADSSSQTVGLEGSKNAADSNKQQTDTKENADTNANILSVPVSLNTSRTVVLISDASTQIQKPVLQQVADQILVNYNQSKSEFKMELYPENLGKVSVKLSIENSVLTVSFLADNPKTQSLLLSHAGHIQSVLQDTVNQPVQVIEQQPKQWYQQYQGNSHQSPQQDQQQQQNRTYSSFDTVEDHVNNSEDFLTVMQRLRMQVVLS